MTPAIEIPPDRGARPAARRRLGLVAGVAAILALHWWLALTAQIGKGVVYDETAHLVSGYAYNRLGDYRLQPENGNLPQRWGALPLVASAPPPRLEPRDEALLWHNSHVWGIAHKFLFYSGNNTDYLVFKARAAMALWSVATGLLVFAWSRRVWGAAAGWCSLGLFALSPTILAHGPLVTSDMCAAFWLLAATGSWWLLTERVTPARLVVAALATGLACVAKFSAVLLFPIFGLIVAWRVLDRHRGAACGAMTSGDAGGPTRLRVFLGLLVPGAAVAVGAWAVIWTFFGWRFSGFAPGLPEGWKYYIPWGELLDAAGIWRQPIVTALKWHLLPEAYIEGFAHLNYQGSARSAFLLGQYSNEGWWWFFPYAFVVKSSLGELLAIAGAAVLGLRQLFALRRSGDWAQARPAIPCLALLLVYGAFSVLSPLNIGHRHILPVYPALFILVGALLRPAAAPLLRRLAAVALVVAGVESAVARPHYLAFFNQAAGGSGNGWRQLVDSSLDWGQDLPALGRWLRENQGPGEPAYVSYFGSGDLAYEGIRARELAGVYAYDKTLRWHELEPGTYAVSATMLQAVYNPWRGPWNLEREGTYRALRRLLAQVPAEPGGAALAERNAQLKVLDELRFARLTFYLRARRAEATIGHTIFIFRLSAAEIATVVDGSLTDLANAMERAGQQR